MGGLDAIGINVWAGNVVSMVHLIYFGNAVSDVNTLGFKDSFEMYLCEIYKSSYLDKMYFK